MAQAKLLLVYPLVKEDSFTLLWRCDVVIPLHKKKGKGREGKEAKKERERERAEEERREQKV